MALGLALGLALVLADPVLLPAKHLGAESAPKPVHRAQGRNRVSGSDGAGVSWLQAGTGLVGWGAATLVL